MSWAAIIVGAGTAIYSGVRASSQAKKARELEKQNDFPDQTIPQAALTNQKLAEQAYNLGLPEPVVAAANQRINRSRNNALKAAGDRGNALGVLPYIQQNADDASLNLAGADADARQKNLQLFMNTNNQVADWQNNIWDWNKRQKYIQNAAAIRSLLGASNANWNTAVDRGLGTAGNAIGALNEGNFGGGDESNGGYYSNGSYVGE